MHHIHTIWHWKHIEITALSGLKILLVIEKIFLCISKYSNISRNLKAIKDAAGRGVRIFSSTKNQVQSRYEMKSMVIIWWYKGRTCPSRGVTDMDMRNEGWQHGYMVRDEIKDLIFILNMIYAKRHQYMLQIKFSQLVDLLSICIMQSVNCSVIITDHWLFSPSQE